MKTSAFLVCMLATVAAFAGGTGREKTTLPSFSELLHRQLSLTEAINIAAEQNSVILAARKEVEARYGVAVQVRAIVLPKVLAEAGYAVRQDSLIEQNQNRELPSADVSIPTLGIDTTVG